MGYNRMEVHSHTHFSNLRLLDCINTPEALIDKAIERGLSGICITDHESLAGHIIVNKHTQKILKEHPDFKVGLGNEIYLVGARESKIDYYHFILIAKNAMGHKALRELSSNSWLNFYEDRRMERVPTLYSELEKIVHKYPNSLIATTACIGGELGKTILNLTAAEKANNKKEIEKYHNNIVEFILWQKNLFGDDFYIEMAPSCAPEQLIVNQRLMSIANCFGVKIVIGTDAHYLDKEQLPILEGFLNSKGGEREVASFYKYAYLQTNEEIFENLRFSKEEIVKMFDNSMEIYDKIENYSLLHSQTIPKVEVQDYPKKKDSNLPNTLNSLLYSENPQERYWVNECLNSLFENEQNGIIPKEKHKEYIDRLEIEADIVKSTSESLNDCVFAYFNTFKHYIDLFWECGSMVGPGRGSAPGFLSNFLLGITQVDPIAEDLYYWRFMNKERVTFPDIDIDLNPYIRPKILNKIKEERSKKFAEGVSKEFGCTLVATFTTMSSKAAILAACRGYRSEYFPNGIDSDEAQYMSALVPSERGFVWSLSDMFYGDETKDRKPVITFIRKVEQYEGLKDIMISIEGLISARSSHASGVIMFDEDPFEFGCFMRTPSGEIITQYDLHDCEDAGLTKYDYLLTAVTAKLQICLEELQKDGIIEQGSLREIYNKYLHPHSMKFDVPEVWKALEEGSVLDCFQFNTSVGLSAAKKIKPKSPYVMTEANAVLRLMAQDKGGEQPIDKYVRFKNSFPQCWEDEMKSYGVTKEEKDLIYDIYAPSYGCPCLQESMMLLLMKAANFTLKEADFARKVVAKKKMKEIPILEEMVYSRISHKEFADYIWDTGIKPQLGYAFSKLHSYVYSFIGIQTLVLATQFPAIYWNTACLIVNSSSIEDTEKEKSVDYAKIAKALGEIKSHGITISLININKSELSFAPDNENNRILYGLKALSGINAEVIEKIIAGRPYKSIMDFMSRCPLNKTQMVSLIKSGAFDEISEKYVQGTNLSARHFAMAYYIDQVCDKKNKLTLTNLKMLLDKKIFPQDICVLPKKVYFFNKYLKQLGKQPLDVPSIEFLNNNGFEKVIEYNGEVCTIDEKGWKKIYESQMDEIRAWLKQNQVQALKLLNELLFQETWDKYAKGSLSKYEMDSLCFYYHEHELINVNCTKYGISQFKELPEEPEIETLWRGKIPIYKLTKIIGTVIAKNDTKSTVALLTTNGVVEVKFNKEYYAMYSKQLSSVQENGVKKVIEKGWFVRGNKILVTGFRREDTFVAKTYANTGSHTLYQITEVYDNGDIELIHERAQ